MLSVVQVFHEREEWLGQEEEVVAERREVGCQWESPEEERKDVGCQSDSAERRNVAVQVDLLTEQLYGMAWRCVAVRADEPGGGALLQHCSTPRSQGHTVYNTLLPIMPLCGPASPTGPILPESKDSRLTVQLPSTPSVDVSAAPPGLIAPLSPHLAEEQEEEDAQLAEKQEEEDEGPLKQEISDTQVRVNKRSAGTVKTNKKRRSEQPTRGISVKLPRRSRKRSWRGRRRRMRSHGEKINQSEERRNVRIKTQEGAEDKTREAGKENEKLDEVMKKRRRRRSKTVDELTPGKMKLEVTHRPRRKAVGPPIRYLLEYEYGVWSHGKSVTNHEKGGGQRREEEKGKNEEVESQERINSSQEVSEGMALKQLHLSIHRKGSRLRGTTFLRLRRLQHHNIRARCRRNTAVPLAPRSVDKPEEEVEGKKRDVEKGKTMGNEGVMARNRRRSRREKERGVLARKRRGREKLEMKLAERPRRMMVGPPIRYLLESEEKTHVQDKANKDAVCSIKRKVGRPRKVRVDDEASGETTLTGLEEPPIRYLLESEEKSQCQETANQDEAKGIGGVGKPQKKTVADGEALSDRTTAELTEKQMDLTNQACGVVVRVESEAVGVASGVTYLTSGTKRERQKLKKKGQSEKRNRDQMVKQEGGEEEWEEKVEEALDWQRRTMVDPPIRHLLKSEEKTQCQETANQAEATGTGGIAKPQKKTVAVGEVAATGWELNSQEKSKSEGGALKQETTMIDMPEDTEQKVRQEGETDTDMKTSLINQDRPKHRGGRPRKVRGRSKRGGGASEMSDGTELEGHKETQRSRRKRKKRTEEEEVGQVCVKDRGEEKEEEGRKEKRTESPQRPRRTMVGPPIRYLLESEEQSHGRDTTNQGSGCIRKVLKGNEAGDMVVEDVERPKRRPGRPRKVRDDIETGDGALEGKTDIETQTGTQSHLIYFDPESGQVTVFSPCRVRVQRLL